MAGWSSSWEALRLLSRSSRSASICFLSRPKANRPDDETDGAGFSGSGAEALASPPPPSPSSSSPVRSITPPGPSLALFFCSGSCPNDMAIAIRSASSSSSSPLISAAQFSAIINDRSILGCRSVKYRLRCCCCSCSSKFPIWARCRANSLRPPRPVVVNRQHTAMKECGNDRAYSQ